MGHIGAAASDLDSELYDQSAVYVDGWTVATSELSCLRRNRIPIDGTLGEVMAGKMVLPPMRRRIIYHGMGLASIDLVMAQAIDALNDKLKSAAADVVHLSSRRQRPKPKCLCRAGTMAW